MSRRKALPIETEELCSYGCGQVARYRNGSGNLMCSESSNSCPVNRKKNSNGITKAHKEGRILGWNKNENVNRGWSKGLTKESDCRIRKSAEKLKSRYASGDLKPFFLGKHHTEETKKNLSEKRIIFLESNPNNNIKWYDFGGIKVQGNWEKLFAERLNFLSIRWTRKKLTFLKYRKYTPDFYLIDYDMYIEIKGYLRENDKYKMHLALEENDIDLRILERIEMIKTFTKDDIKSFSVFKNLYKKEEIDMTKFTNHWM